MNELFYYLLSLKCTYTIHYGMHWFILYTKRIIPVCDSIDILKRHIAQVHNIRHESIEHVFTLADSVAAAPCENARNQHIETCSVGCAS